MGQGTINEVLEEIQRMRKRLAKIEKILKKKKQPVALLEEIEALNYYIRTLEDSNNDLIERNYILEQMLEESNEKKEEK